MTFCSLGVEFCTGTGTVKCRFAGMVIRTKAITMVTAGVRTVHAVLPWERKSKIIFQRTIDSAGRQVLSGEK